MGTFGFKPGTTVVEHGDLLSFTREGDFRLYHQRTTSEKREVLRRLHQGDMVADSPFLDTIVQAGYGMKTGIGAPFSFLPSQEPQALHLLAVLTNLCDMACDYCYTESNKHLDVPELDADAWIGIFDALALPSPYRAQKISLTGGEPLRHPGFKDIFAAISTRYDIEISTNGFRLEDDVIKLLGETASVHLVNVSMDSHRKDHDERHRGTGTFDRRLRNLSALHEAGVPLCIGAVIGKHNLDDMIPMHAWYTEKFPGISLKYIPLTRMGSARFLPAADFLDATDTQAYLANLLSLQGVQGDPGDRKGLHDDHWSGRCTHMKCDAERQLYGKTSVERTSERCNAGYGVVSLSPQGVLRPCLRPDSFFDDTSRFPSLAGLDGGSIGRLPFWQETRRTAEGFDARKTCAYKHARES